MPHLINLISLTSWKMKRENNSSAHATCDGSDITYILESEGNGQSFSPCHMQWIQHHLLAGRWRARAIYQLMPHAINSLTSWKVKGEGNLSAYITYNESDITYKLKNKAKGQFISPCHMQWNWYHLLAGRWRGWAICQPTPHAMNPTLLTNWKVNERAIH